MEKAKEEFEAVDDVVQAMEMVSNTNPTSPVIQQSHLGESSNTSMVVFKQEAENHHGNHNGIHQTHGNHSGNHNGIREIPILVSRDDKAESICPSTEVNGGVMVPYGNGGRADGWESARAWLMTLPRRRNVNPDEIEEWLQANKHSLSKDVITLPRSDIYKYLVTQHKLIRRNEQTPDPPTQQHHQQQQGQMETAEWLEPPTPRFKRSNKWKPIYSWLETLEIDFVVKSKAIKDWLSENPEVRDELLARHSTYHLVHYIQKCHTNLIQRKKKELQKTKIPGSSIKRKTSADVDSMHRKQQSADLQSSAIMNKKTGSTCMDKPNNNINVAFHGTVNGPDGRLKDNLQGFVDLNSRDLREIQVKQQDGDTMTGTVMNDYGGDNDFIFMSREEALKRCEILSDLQHCLVALISKSKQQRTASNLSAGAVLMADRNGLEHYESNGDIDSRSRRRSHDSFQSQQDFANQERSRFIAEGKAGNKRRKMKDNMDLLMYAWARSETSSVQKPQVSSIEEKTEGVSSMEEKKTEVSGQYRTNIVRCLQGREAGLCWPLTSNLWFAGRRLRKWKSVLEGWDSLGKQFEGSMTCLERNAYSSWIPSWSAYTSSVAVAQPLGRMDQTVQKVLDVRFHPGGLPQLVCSSNEAPNELLLYNLIAGRATELGGHNCQIQAVEYAVGGASIVSCGGNLLKVWDSQSGACLFTLGAKAENAASVGHKKKINAMTVNSWQSCLVATSGCEGDGQLLLWNVLLGDVYADINAEIRKKNTLLPPIDAMEFCSQNILACGSDSIYGSQAVVQLWDIEATQGCATFPAHDSYITSLKINPTGSTLITGAGDGTVGLFDVRTCGGISRLYVGLDFEVTSVSFSNCGTYFHASSTANCTLVWDTRMMPMSRGSMPIDGPLPVTDLNKRSMRPLHCLSHGEQMPTAENAGQLPGYVDEGDQGVNDGHWFHNKPILVTASGNGSIAMWDVTLGQPCIRHIKSHTRCVNSIAIAPNDEYISSGGDDQKVVLYHDSSRASATNWRLTHPLSHG